MKLNLLPLCFSLIFVGCLKDKEVKILDSGEALTSGSPVLEPTIDAEVSPSRPLRNLPYDAKFCDKGQTYRMRVVVATDYMDYRGSLSVRVLTNQKSQEVHLFYQDGQITKKDHLDTGRTFCEITSFINPKPGKKYRISGTINSNRGSEQVENKSICRGENVNQFDIKDGEGVISEIACSKNDPSELKIEDIKEAMGRFVRIAGSAL